MIGSGRGVQFEVLASLTLVMVTATGFLAAFMIRTQGVQLDHLRGLIGHALHAEANAPAFRFVGGSDPVQWWIEEAGELRPLGAQRENPSETLEQLAASARLEGGAVVGAGRPWEPLRFATPIGDGREVAVGRIAPAVSGGVLLSMLLADCVVFIAIGAYLLRRRVLVPLRQLALAAGEIGQGARGTRVHVDGGNEAAEVALAFNEMSEALEQRGIELEKAISDLRESNRSLRTARDGLDRAERLASVGSLAAGVAHEVGNPMGALLAFLDLARRDTALSQVTAGYLERASEQGARVREILRQLLDFSRPPRSERKPVDLAAMARQTIGLVKAQSRYEDVCYVLEVADAVPSAIADESVVAQILLNLVINASDAALEAGDEPRVEVHLHTAPLVVRGGDGESASAQRRRVLDGVEC
ncbi:MAG: HAMP domain-containing protein, partial [bacterium]|nr:HAMP domain-containing protein [bacterium]